jgi:hypothetical protein
MPQISAQTWNVFCPRSSMLRGSDLIAAQTGKIVDLFDPGSAPKAHLTSASDLIRDPVYSNGSQDPLTRRSI